MAGQAMPGKRIRVLLLLVHVVAGGTSHVAGDETFALLQRTDLVAMYVQRCTGRTEAGSPGSREHCRLPQTSAAADGLYGAGVAQRAEIELPVASEVRRIHDCLIMRSVRRRGGRALASNVRAPGPWQRSQLMPSTRLSFAKRFSGGLSQVK